MNPTHTRILFVLAMFLLAGATTATADILPNRRPIPQAPLPSAAEACAPIRISSVEDVQLHVHGAVATLEALGTVSTLGWRTSQLRFMTVQSPDGPNATAVYEFVGCPPEIGAEVISPVSASTIITVPLSHLHRIVVKAASNERGLAIDAPAP